MSDEKLDKDLETEVNQEAEATKVAEKTEAAKEAEPPAEPVVTAGETRVSPATANTQSEDGQKDATTKRNRMVAVVACCLVALAALIGGVGYVSGAFAGADQTSQATADQKADDASDDKSAQSQQTDQGKADEAVSADAATTAEQTSEQQDQTAQTDASASIDSGESSNAGGSSSGDTSSYSGTGEVVEEEPAPQPEPAPAPAPDPQPESTPAPQPATITVYVNIDSSRANHYDSSWPTSMGGGTVTLSEGSSVYDALCALGVSVGGNSSYVSSINGLSQMACGSMSGWTYNVNGVYANKACGKYILSGGETVNWVYTTNDEPTMPM